MKLNVLGVKLVTGKAKESGNPFSICQVIAMTPIESVQTENVQVRGHGLEVAELPLDEKALDSFSGVKFPCELQLETDTRPFRGKFETFVTGFKPVAKSA